MTANEKVAAAHDAVRTLEKKHGNGTVMMPGREPEPVSVIPPGCASLELALGCGGYPRGRVVEVFGQEGSGKTTLALHAIAECQRAGGLAAFIDAEHALDLGYAKQVGVAIERLLVSQPDCGEQALEIVETLVRSGAVDLVVVDSVAALVPRAELDGEMGDEVAGLQARLMSQAMRKLVAVAARTGTCIVFVNQLRMRVGVTFGSPETTTGGNALKFYSSVRLDVRRIGQVRVGDEVRGQRVRVKVVKNKLAPPFKTAEVDLLYGQGLDAAGDLLDLATEMGITTRHDSYRSFRGESLGATREAARARLQEDAPLADEIRAALAREVARS